MTAGKMSVGTINVGMIQVGVDEAGYGPKLGPLVVTATSVRRPAFAKASSGQALRSFSEGRRPVESPDLYAALAPAVARSRRARRPKRPKAAGGEDERSGALLVADSKTVFSQGSGLGELERGVLAFLRASGASGVRGGIGTDLGLLGTLCAPAPDLSGLPWYEGPPEPLPVEADARDIHLAAEGLLSACELARCAAPVFRARLVTAREFNRAIGRGLNKAELLLEVVAELLAEACDLSDREARPAFSVLVDRLGGRKFYSGLLRKAFPGEPVREESVSPAESSYLVGSTTRSRRRGMVGPGCRVTFACRAESRCMTVALSSMVSKYVRELLMRRLNRYFERQVPGLKATAGYPVDAARFLEDTRDFRRRSGLPDELLIRAR